MSLLPPAGSRWHVNCKQVCRIVRMATKMKIMKLLQEVRGLAEISSRRPQSRLPGLALMQMRSHAFQSTAARPKRTLAVEVQEPLDIPHPVKITYLQANPGPAAASPNP